MDTTTAGHCGGPGAPVVVEGANSHSPVGTVAAVGDGMDYGVIKIDPNKVAPTANFARFAINGIGPDRHAHACTNGAANGIQCGGIASIPGPGPRSAMSHAVFLPGNDGAPVASGDLLIGLVQNGQIVNADPTIPEVDFTHYTKFSGIMNDVNAKGAPGAGFTPTPGLNIPRRRELLLCR